MHIVDLRSDTLTQPTEAMRRAMAEAEVGDDVFGEDPTVRRLEEMAADRTGKEAALFVSSGTMANLVSELTHCRRGDEMILGDQAHIFYYEQGGSAAVGGIHPRILPNLPDGRLDPDAIEAAVRPDDVHFPITRLIVLENTHNRCGGAPLDAAYMGDVGKVAQKHGLKIHVDGARIFNAAIALGVEAKQLLTDADSVSFCLSKGLCAPVGSLVCGSKDFIDGARRNRKLLGGGMRQAGVLAAAGIVALTEMVDRLVEDHANARKLAEGLAGMAELRIDPLGVRTNILYFELDIPSLDAPAFTQRLAGEGVRMLPTGPRQIRAVAHHPLTSADMDAALDAFRRVLAG
ncbi:MAG: low-specificity L-threonine aldolase [Desulfobacteraceae bacterium]|jgi:threonine aldolase|nr:low-specificity L-threonine aldolase [Desulfobacteraceae bacterium]